MVALLDRGGDKVMTHLLGKIWNASTSTIVLARFLLLQEVGFEGLFLFSKNNFSKF